MLIDESHNLRNTGTQRYRVVQDYMARIQPALLPPDGDAAQQVPHGMFTTRSSSSIRTTKPTCRLIRRPQAVFQADREGANAICPNCCRHILIRRTRNAYLALVRVSTPRRMSQSTRRDFANTLTGQRRAYVMVGGRHQFFPKRELETIEYSIEDTYQGLYQELRGYLGKQAREERACRQAARRRVDLCPVRPVPTM